MFLVKTRDFPILDFNRKIARAR